MSGYDHEFVDSTLEFTEEQIKQALIWHFDLPKDTKIRLDKTSNYDRFDQPVGVTWKATASFKRHMKTRKLVEGATDGSPDYSA